MCMRGWRSMLPGSIVSLRCRVALSSVLPVSRSCLFRCYSEASDAFSFGVVLYEMFTRRPPWDGHENLDVAFRVCSGERMTVSHV